MSGSKERLAEMAGDNLVWLAHGGKVDAGVPTKQYIDVCRYGLQLVRGEHGRRLGREEGGEQFGDAGDVHGNFRL